MYVYGLKVLLTTGRTTGLFGNCTIDLFVNRLSDYNAYYHQEQLEGLVRVTRMLLHHRYPRYLEDGGEL